VYFGSASHHIRATGTPKLFQKSATALFVKNLLAFGARIVTAVSAFSK
jgi:hypothetical protein